MKVGDLVQLGYHETLKGLSWEDKIGIVVDITSAPGFRGGRATVNFDGTIIEYAVSKLRVVSEGR